QPQRLPAHGIEGHHHGAGLGRSWDACLEIAEPFAIVATQNLEMRIGHPVVRREGRCVEGLDSLPGRRAEIPVLRAPTVVPEPRACSEHLSARMEHWIVRVDAESHRLLDGHDAPVWIDEPERTDQATQRLSS